MIAASEWIGLVPSLLMLGAVAGAGIGGWLMGRARGREDVEDARRRGWEDALKRVEGLKPVTPDQPGEWPVVRVSSPEHPLRLMTGIYRKAPERATGLDAIREHWEKFNQEGQR